MFSHASTIVVLHVFCLIYIYTPVDYDLIQYWTSILISRGSAWEHQNSRTFPGFHEAVPWVHEDKTAGAACGVWESALVPQGLLPESLHREETTQVRTQLGIFVIQNTVYYYYYNQNYTWSWSSPLSPYCGRRWSFVMRIVVDIQISIKRLISIMVQKVFHRHHEVTVTMEED